MLQTAPSGTAAVPPEASKPDLLKELALLYDRHQETVFFVQPEIAFCEVYKRHPVRERSALVPVVDDLKTSGRIGPNQVLASANHRGTVSLESTITVGLVKRLTGLSKARIDYVFCECVPTKGREISGAMIAARLRAIADNPGVLIPKRT